jgi:hypothetical protein
LGCYHLGFTPIGLARLLAVKDAISRAGHMDKARAFFPAAPRFFELSGLGILRMTAFTFLSVASTKLQSHMKS